MNSVITKILSYLVAILVGIAFGLWIPKCGSGQSGTIIPPVIESFIKSDTTIVKQPPQILKGRSITQERPPIKPSIVMPTQSDLVFNWNAVATIDSLIGKMRIDSVHIIYRDTQSVGNGNIVRLSFDEVMRKFDSVELVWNEPQKVITRTVTLGKNEWYEEPIFVGSTALLLGFALGYLIKK